MKKKKAHDSKFKKTGEELHQWLLFTRRGSKVTPKRGKGSYSRQQIKRGGENE